MCSCSLFANFINAGQRSQDYFNGGGGSHNPQGLPHYYVLLLFFQILTMLGRGVKAFSEGGGSHILLSPPPPLICVLAVFSNFINEEGGEESTLIL